MPPTRSLEPGAGLATAVLAAALAACSSDGGGPTLPEDVLIPAAIQAQIDALFPTGNLNESATEQVEEVLEQAEAGQSAEAESAFIGFVAFGADQAGAGALLDPGDAAPPTIEEALADLSDDVADAAGLTAPPIPAAAFGETGAAAVLDGAGGTVVTGDGNAGVQVPAGALAEATLITIEPIPATGDPAEHDGPLDTSLDQYPRFYRIETFPPIGTLIEPAVVGVCVVDPPDPFAPTLEIAARLRIGHPVPNLPEVIEILPLADASFLGCIVSLSDLALASPGALGGRISAFSPIAAVDPGAGSAPVITSVAPNPITSSVTPGSSTVVTIGFEDPDADVVILDIRELSDTNEVLAPGPQDLSDVTGQVSGTFTIDVGCPPDVSACRTGTWTGDFVLVDAEDNESEPFRVTIVFE